MVEKGPQQNRMGWYVLLAVFVLGALALSLYTCDRDQTAYERSQQEDWDRRHGR